MYLIAPRAASAAALFVLLLGFASAHGQEAKPVVITGVLKRDDPLDEKLKHPSRVHEFKMSKGQTFVIRLNSSDFDAFLILRDSKGKELAFNDDDPDNPPTLNSKLVFTAPKVDTYTIVATSFDGKLGKYELTIEAASKKQTLAEATKLDAREQVMADKAANLNSEAVKLNRAGNPKEAAKKVSEGLEILRKLYPKDRYPQGHTDLAQSLNNLGALLQRQGEYAKAEPFLRDALAMRQALYPKNRYPQGHPDLVSSLNNLGILLQSQVNYAKAEPYFRDALAMRQTLYPKGIYPEGHTDLAQSLNNLGALLLRQGEYAKAEPFLRDALAMRQALYPKDRYPQGHPGSRLPWSNLRQIMSA